MNTDLPNLLDAVGLPKLLLTILFIIPGFLAEEELRRKFPLKPSTTFERTIYSIYRSVLIHSFLVIPACLYFFFKLGHLPWTVELQPLAVFIYCTLAIVTGKLYGQFFLVKYYAWSKETSSLLPLWVRTLPYNKTAFARVKLKNGDIYSGQIKYIPSGHDLLSNAEKDMYIVEAYTFKDGTWQSLVKEGVEGILLNTRDIISLELAFKDVEDAPG